MVTDAGLPATWFITSGQLGRRRFWWDRLAEGLLGPHALPDSVDVEVAGRGLWLDLRSTTARRTAMFFLHRRLSALPPDAIEDAVDRILGRLEAPEPVADNLTMTVAQLRVLADLPLQDVGAHTRTHLRLRGQDPELQREEILGSVVDLVELLDRPVELFAYPFGGSSAVGSVAPRLAAEAGCTLAVSTDHGAVDGRSDRYRLPRLNVQNWHGDEFADRLDELGKVAMRSTRPYRSARAAYTRMRFGDLRRTEPLSAWGSARGTPVDRWYIERYLQGHAASVHGHALEVKNDMYASRYGAATLDVVDIDAGNDHATIVGDLCLEDTLPQGAFDVAIVTQTLQYVPDPEAAVGHLLSALRPGGCLLVTVPTLSRITDDTDRWRWTPSGLAQLLRAAAPPGAEVTVEGPGNGLACRAFLFGLAAEELGDDVLARTDPNYPLIAAGSVCLPR